MKKLKEKCSKKKKKERGDEDEDEKEPEIERCEAESLQLESAKRSRGNSEKNSMVKRHPRKLVLNGILGSPPPSQCFQDVYIESHEQLES